MKRIRKTMAWIAGVALVALNAYSLMANQQETMNYSSAKKSYFVIRWIENEKTEGNVYSYDVVTTCMSGGNQYCQEGRYKNHFIIPDTDITRPED